jgi:hypothetical protein
MKIDNEYLYLPKRFWNKHNQCELLVRQIEEFVINDTYQELRTQKFDLDSENDIKTE